MGLGEFELIRAYFTPSTARRDDVALGVGDDAALCRVPPGMELAVAVDTLVAGVHFPADAAPRDVGHKALAVNLSDLAAMGAEPAWLTLALTCPEADPAWLAAFSRGLLELAETYNVELVGGDTTRGPLTVSVQVLGLVPAGRALRRAGAKPGDAIYVTGTLGDAGLGLQSTLGRIALPPSAREFVEGRLHRPTPRVREGLALRGVASAAIDISDGLLADLGHILEHSGGGARLELDALPLSPALRAHLAQTDAWELALGAGDDYELCFTAPPGARPPIACARIGRIEAEPGIRCLAGGQAFAPRRQGYRHFS